MPSPKPNPLTFQELILRLQTFWAERGCVLQQPYDVEVGAGPLDPGHHLAGEVEGVHPVADLGGEGAERARAARQVRDIARLGRQPHAQQVLPRHAGVRVQQAVIRLLVILGGVVVPVLGDLVGLHNVSSSGDRVLAGGPSHHGGSDEARRARPAAPLGWGA